uniref:Putative secreted protein n=1 Tax=Anopheles darlingi TaxID=43151 RepID=A0A2M4DR38_ANODA
MLCSFVWRRKTVAQIRGLFFRLVPAVICFLAPSSRFSAAIICVARVSHRARSFCFIPFTCSARRCSSEGSSFAASSSLFFSRGPFSSRLEMEMRARTLAR